MTSLRKKLSRLNRTATIGKTTATNVVCKMPLMYFKTRKSARDYASSSDIYTVVDRRDNPNIDGFGWAVQVSPHWPTLG